MIEGGYPSLALHCEADHVLLFGSRSRIIFSGYFEISRFWKTPHIIQYKPMEFLALPCYEGSSLWGLDLLSSLICFAF